MLVRHIAHGLNVEKELPENTDAGTLLTNKAGSYAWINSCDYGQPLTNYQGVFFFTQAERMFRIIECINPVGSGKILEVNNHFSHVERIRENLKESFVMPTHFSAMAYKADKRTTLEIILDVKESYDNRSMGRHYDIYEEKGTVVVEFTKKTDRQEDSSNGVDEYKMFLVIASKDRSLSWSKVDKWFERKYPSAEKRGSRDSRWVYHALNATSDNLVFAFSGNKKHAIKEAKHLVKKFDNLFTQRSINTAIKLETLPDDETRMAYISAVNSLSSLSALHHGLFAGLPWFFQYWTRDTAISLKALMLEHREKLAKEILLDYINHICVDGKIPNRVPSSELGSADGVGWVFRRFHDLLKIHKFSKKEKHRLSERLHHSIYLLQKYRTQNSLAINKNNETWMDTDNLGDARAGSRIEIQALRLSMYNLMSDFYGNGKYLKLEQQLKRAIKNRFWNSRYLNDGFVDGNPDKTIRPNIFLAAYIFPPMLSKDDWDKCFGNVINKLWLDWGGLSSIDKKSPIFQEYNTGSNIDSYHRGDSWYFVNNMAAIVLHKTDKKKYRRYINKILEASREEILWQGALGHHAEISSAAYRQSTGCVAQLWSAAMFVELIHELYG